MNQTDFGKLLGIAQNGISKMERGIYAPTLHQLYKISSGLKVPVSALFGYKRPDKIYRTYKAFRMAFSERLRRIRLERNLSQKELAEKVGMKQPTYNVIEKGEDTQQPGEDCFTRPSKRSAT
jgi:transcriptional regulator with XRE-family HTH domain